VRCSRRGRARICGSHRRHDSEWQNRPLDRGRDPTGSGDRTEPGLRLDRRRAPRLVPTRGLGDIHRSVLTTVRRSQARRALHAPSKALVVSDLRPGPPPVARRWRGDEICAVLGASADRAGGGKPLRVGNRRWARRCCDGSCYLAGHIRVQQHPERGARRRHPPTLGGSRCGLEYMQRASSPSLRWPLFRSPTPWSVGWRARRRRRRHPRAKRAPRCETHRRWRATTGCCRCG
jgi:hypothetical protein